MFKKYLLPRGAEVILATNGLLEQYDSEKLSKWLISKTELSDIPYSQELMSRWRSMQEFMKYVWLRVSGAHEPPKVAKEHETYASCQVPSQSKFIGHYNQLVSI